MDLNEIVYDSVDFIQLQRNEWGGGVILNMGNLN
jgi:hypothetical protein